MEETKSLILIKPNEDVEVRAFYSEALKLLEYAQARVITTAEDMKPATDDLSVIRRVKKALEEKRKDYLKPFQDHVKEVNEIYKKFMEPIEQADKITGDKMLAFNAEQNRIRQAQEEINRKRMEAAEAEIKLKGELTESVNLIEVSPLAPKRVSTDMGTAGMRDNYKWEVTDFALVPNDYKIINAGVLTPIVKASKGKITIPGIRIYNEPIIAVNTK